MLPEIYVIVNYYNSNKALICELDSICKYTLKNIQLCMSNLKLYLNRIHCIESSLFS